MNELIERHNALLPGGGAAPDGPADARLRADQREARTSASRSTPSGSSRRRSAPTGHRLCGSTSTTAVSPARRIAGAADASSAAARVASAARLRPSCRRAARDGGRAGAGAAPGRAARRRRARLQLLERAHRRRPAPARRRRCARGARTAGSRAHGAARAPRRGSRRRRAGQRARSARASGWNVCTSTRPGASRPLRPASWVSSWKVRSSARKSGSPSPVSASTTAASSTPGKWWPFATICVPTSTARSRVREALERVAQLLRLRDRVGVEADHARARAACFASSRSSFCVPAPMRASSAEPQAGHVSPIGSERAAVVAAQRARPRAASSATSQLGQRRVAPQARQWTAGATPRRLRSRIAFPPPLRESRRAPRGAAPRADSRPRGAGRRRAPTAAARRSARRARAARATATTPGAASPTRTPRPRPRARRASPPPCARRSADRTPACTTRRAPRRRRRRRASGTGANTAERAPTTTGASPDAIRSRSSRRSASLSAEWRTATRSPKRARKRPSVCGVSAISGTSTIAPRPRRERRRARADVHLGLAAPGRAVEQDVAAAAVEQLLDPRRAPRPAAATACSGAGSASSASVRGVPAARRAASACGGATSASARAGVEP